jgi:uncharacterized membrane protein (UPF0127 family)
MKRLAFCLAFFCITSGVALAECRSDQVRLSGDWGETLFSVELADTPQERSQGLMFRESMPRGAGMLFVYDAPQRASFWMKNTLISLDMVFVDSSGTVRRVHHEAIPGDLTAIDGGSGIFAVLEINGGLAEAYGIAPGTVLQHPVFSDGPAAWPC